VIAACLKWVDRRPEVDPVDGRVATDARTAGTSDADDAALEWALRCGEAWREPVLALTVGPDPADAVLRDALAAGADRAVRIPTGSATTAIASSAVAQALASVIHEIGVTFVWCGDYSLDRGSGSVPVYLAAELGWPQALGLVEVTAAEPGHVSALRRLDGGRRERLAVHTRAVLSVEGSTARLRRASLDAALTSRAAAVEVRTGSAVVASEPMASTLRPFRPRARVLPAPRGTEARDRVLALTETSTAKAHREVVTLDPPAAAERILAALVEWGYEAPPREP